MAVSLGVADEVIKQLKMVAPEVLDDPMMRPAYGWYYFGMYGGLGTPASVFGGAAREAHSVSTAALARSVMEFKVYGTAGKPVLVFPSQDGRFYDFENQGM